MSLKVLGQSSPSANTDTTLYAAPSGYQTVVSTLMICNRATADSRIRVAIRPSGEAIENKHYIYYDTVIPARDSLSATLGLSISSTDIITVRSDSNNVSFGAFGDEVLL